MNEVKYEYDAFISYRHLPLDKTIAEKLQVLLESYKPPKSGAYTRTNRIKRIFRDQSELQTSSDLGADIRRALEQSAFLIVICSESTSESRWCLEEIEYFKSLHGGKCSNILSVVISGEPSEVFPEPLTYEVEKTLSPDGDEVESRIEIEPLAAKIVADTTAKSRHLLKSEFLRIAAPILGCGYDDLFRRHQKRIVRRTIQFSVVALAVIVSVGFFMFFNQQRINEMNRIADEQRILAESERVMRTLNVAENLIGSGDKVLASALICEMLDSVTEPGDYTKSEIERLLSQSTYVPIYTQYAVLQSDENVTETIFINEHELLTATKRGTITVWNADNGALLRQFDAGAPVLAMLWDNDTLYAVTQTKNVITWDTVSWKKTGDFSFDDGRTNLALYEISDIMLSGGKLYLREDLYGYTVTAVDLSTKESVLMYQYEQGVWTSYDDCYFDKERGMVIITDNSNLFMGIMHNTVTDEAYSFTYDSIYDYSCYNAEKGEIVLLYGDYDAESDKAFLRFEIGSLLGEGGRTVNLSMDESYCDFYPDYCTEAQFSQDGSYLALGDYYGNVVIVDMDIGRFVNGYNADYPKIKQIKYLDYAYIFVSSSDTQAESGMYYYAGSENIHKAIPGSSNLDVCVVNPEETIMAIVGVGGSISLFSLIDANIEDYIFDLPDQLKKTNESVYSYGEPDGFYKTDGIVSGAYYVSTEAVDADERYSLIRLLSADKPEYIANMGNGDYSSYWLADYKTGEIIYNVNMPMDFIAADIKDDTTATLLTASYFIHDIDMQTGKILSSSKLNCPFKDDRLSMITKFGVNYETGKGLLAVSSHDFESGAKSKGIMFSKASGKTLFDFSDFFGTKFLGFDKRATRIYKYDLANPMANNYESGWGNLDWGVEDDDTIILEIVIPDYERLVEIAREQTSGRVISEREKEIMGLQVEN